MNLIEIAHSRFPESPSILFGKASRTQWIICRANWWKRSGLLFVRGINAAETSAGAFSRRKTYRLLFFFRRVTVNSLLWVLIQAKTNSDPCLSRFFSQRVSVISATRTKWWRAFIARPRWLVVCKKKSTQCPFSLSVFPSFYLSSFVKTNSTRPWNVPFNIFSLCFVSFRSPPRIFVPTDNVSLSPFLSFWESLKESRPLFT